MVVAYIAYSNLDPKTRQRVDALLRQHPDYKKWVEGTSTEEAVRARAAFLAASTWPDRMRDDHRFFDDNGQPTPPAQGFLDMGRHQKWHFIDVPFSTDSTPIPKQIPAPNALTQIALFRESIGNPAVDESSQVYQLPWLLHLVGDVHQPLHCASRFMKTQHGMKTKDFLGDQGGTLVYIKREKNLHVYWDQLLGDAETEESIATLANNLMDSMKKENPVRINPQDWVDESFRIVKEFVYSFGDGGTMENPASLTDQYHTMAGSIARRRVALAGYRLAAMLRYLLAD